MIRNRGGEAGDVVSMAAQCRQLIKNLASPRRLKSNYLAQRVLIRAHDNRDPANVFAAELDAALRHLADRERSIIQRCDIDCEPYAKVASEMAISERHLYRQHNRVLQKIAALMLDPPGDSAIQVLDGDHSISQIAKTCRALEENGAYKIAAEVMGRRALDCLDPVERSRLFLRLAELHARAGSLARADESLTIALRNAE